MTITSQNDIEQEDNFALSALPKTALQAIYHAVTGKTENLSKDLEGNVIIYSRDIDRLFSMLNDQINLHPKLFDPVTTVVVKNSNEKTVTYSSWERFKVLRVNNHDLTSEITLKIEFVIKLPDTTTPQRCTVNINLDSSLPIIGKKSSGDRELEGMGFFLIMRQNWRTVKVSIDFVDFLIAKSFIALTEEWFSTLASCPKKPLNQFILKHMNVVQRILGQISRFGFSVYLIFLVLFSSGSSLSFKYITLAVSFGFMIWSFLFVIESTISRRLIKGVHSNVIPSVILLSDEDDTTFRSVTNKASNPTLVIINSGLSIILALSLNILASYLYSYFSSKP